MGEYLAARIVQEAFTYEYAIKQRPDLKESIDESLTSQGREDLIAK